MALVYIYTGNHLSRSGISDYISALKSILEPSHSVVASPFLPSESLYSHCFIIECFCYKSRHATSSILDCLDELGIKPILVHTEFIDAYGRLNLFNRREKFASSLIPSLIPFFFFSKCLPPFFSRLNQFLFVLLCIYVRILLFDRYGSDTKRVLHFNARSYALSCVIHRFYAHVALSLQVSIATNAYLRSSDIPLRAHLLSPIIRTSQFSFETSSPAIGSPCFFVTGNFTPWRKYILSRLQYLFAASTNPREFDSDPQNSDLFMMYCSSSDLARLQAFKASCSDAPSLQPIIFFELYIPQTKFWPHHSEMRIYRSCTQGFYPISIGKLTDSNMSSLSLCFSSLLCIERLLPISMSKWLPKFSSILDNYNTSAAVQNEKILGILGL
jgi:hypothetical protein